MKINPGHQTVLKCCLSSLSLVVVFAMSTLVARSQDNPEDLSFFRFPSEHGTIRYEYSGGNTTGSQVLYFTDYGNRWAIHTELVHSSSFFGITSQNPESSSEYFYEGRYYYFDMGSLTGHIIEQALGIFNKQASCREEVSDPESYLEMNGALFLGESPVLDRPCRGWSYRQKEYWFWKGIPLRIISKRSNKKFDMVAVEMTFTEDAPAEGLAFPADIPVPFSSDQ